MVAEEYVSTYKKSGKIEAAIILRIFNVYDYGDNSRSDLVAEFATRLSRGLPPLIYGHSTRTRDFISLDDVVDAIILSIRLTENQSVDGNTKSSPLILNIGTGKPTSIGELVK
jgi:nucleoside-diphosphate-sugar epimerase